MNATIAAHDLRSYDCAWPGCPREARRPGGYYDQGHVGTPPKHPAASLKLEPGSLAHLADDPQPDEEPLMPACKIPGCQEQCVDRSGIYGRLCAAHKRERQAARRAVKPPREKGQSQGTPPAQPTSREPAPQAVSNGQVEGTLVELARRVTVAKHDIETATRTYHAAVAELRKALDAA